MGPFLAVALGGGIGSALRYAAGRGAQAAGFESHFATAGVNVLGAFLLGFLTGWLVSTDLSDNARLGLTTGLLGGFTTFSAFMVESSTLINDGRVTTASLNLLLPLVLGVIAAMAGLTLGRSLT